MLLVAEPILGAEEKAALSDVVDSGWITMGNRVRTFEEAFAEQHGAGDAVAVSSCTAALHLILEALGIGPEDEVLVPSLTFVATANCVLYVGATPVFVDIESLEKPWMSIEHAAARCTSRTRAIILVHYAGYLAHLSAWRDFAKERGLLLVEDAAHAVGIDGVGKFSDGAAFSFYGNKNMTTAEGGVVLARSDETLDRVRQMRGHGMTSGTLQRLTNRMPDYDVTMLGYNYRMDELRAAIGLTQLHHLNSWNSKRKILTNVYRRLLEQRCPGVLIPFRNGGISSNHIMPIVLPKQIDRQDVIAGLRDAQIQTTIHYPPVHKLSFYRDRLPFVHLPLTEEFAQRELTLPLHPKMKEEQVERVIMALAQALASCSVGAST
jgi:dTDP-4-amino-4,6-dideoxygalactose transaminase